VCGTKKAQEWIATPEYRLAMTEGVIPNLQGVNTYGVKPNTDCHAALYLAMMQGKFCIKTFYPPMLSKARKFIPYKSYKCF
jgi:hypothetical protein